MTGKTLLETYSLRLLQLNGHFVISNLSTASLDDLESLVERVLGGLVDGDVSVSEIPVLNLIYRLFPVIRNATETDDGSKDTGGGRRIAVRVRTATGGDVDCLPEIHITVEKADQDVCAVENRVDVEGVKDPVRACRSRTPCLPLPR